MKSTYHLDHKPAKRRRKTVLVIALTSLLIMGGIGYVVRRDINKNSNNQVTGKTQVILQAKDDSVNRLNINEALFNMVLPADWKEIKRQNDQIENSITWASTAQGGGRTLKLYIDLIPVTRAVNRELAITAQGDTILVGDISENCATFTKGGTQNVHEAALLKETPAKWNTVDFICDLPRVSDNVVGTGSTEGVNTVTLTGPLKGTHKYFFMYTEHSSQANYEILSNALRSFKAK